MLCAASAGLHKAVSLLQHLSLNGQEAIVRHTSELQAKQSCDQHIVSIEMVLTSIKSPLQRLMHLLRPLPHLHHHPVQT